MLYNYKNHPIQGYLYLNLYLKLLFLATTM